MFMNVVSVIGTLVSIAVAIGGVMTYILKQNPNRRHIFLVSVAIGVALICVFVVAEGVSYLSPLIFAHDQKAPTALVAATTHDTPGATAAHSSPTATTRTVPTATAHPSSPAGVINEFSIPDNGGATAIAAGPDGNLWFTAYQEDSQNNISGRSIERISPGGTITQFPLSNTREGGGITLGPDDNLWFTEYQYKYQNNTPNITESAIGRISSGGTVTQFPLPSNGGPHDIIVGPDHNLWFTEYKFDSQFKLVGGAIGRISPDGAITEFPLSTPNDGPYGITLGPGGNLWFTEYHYDNNDKVTGSMIGRISPDGTITQIPLPDADGGPEGITTGSDGNLWFTEGESHKIGRMSSDGTVAEFPLPDASSGAYPNEIAVGPDGNLWFTEALYDSNFNVTGSKIGRISLSGTVTQFLLPDAKSDPYWITVGPDSNLWFTETGSHKIGRITSGK